MATFDLAYIDSTGYHYPDYETTLAWYQDQYRAIYGADIYLDADSQDGQWIAVQAQAAYDLCALMSVVINSQSPQYAQGVILSNNVKINGIERREETFSTVDVDIVGTVGLTINDGIAQDVNGFQWSIAPFTIGGGGTVTATATCLTGGDINAGVGQVNIIATPKKGWLSVTNSTAATAGVPVESDAELRIKQAESTMLPSSSILDGIAGAIANVDGVTDSRVYENDTGSTDGDGITANTIAAVVSGGTNNDIATAIGVKKTPGVNTQGTSSGTYTDSRGVSKTINFYRPTSADISVDIDITALDGYSSEYEDELKAAVAETINSIGIGNDVLISRLYLPAQLYGAGGGLTYDLTGLEIKKNAGSFVTTNISIDFNEVAVCDVSDITVTVT